MERFIRVAILPCAVIVLLCALSFQAVEAKAAPVSGKIFQSRMNASSCQWSVVVSPNSTVTPDGLSAVATVSAGNLWAVGSAGSQAGGGQTLIEHWNGSQWQIVQSPSPGTDYNTLTGVAVVSANNVWAVGWQANLGLAQTLIEHWNGTKWSVVKSPNPGSLDNELFGVTAISASNVWAVGWLSNNTSTGSVEQTLVEHWNGTKWSVVKSPSPGSQSDTLTSVSAVSASNVWAVGFYANSDGIWRSLTERWNGTKWSIVKSPSPGTQISYLYSVAAISASNAWAVGYADSQTLIEHWNGSQWKVVKSSGPGSVSNLLIGVAAVSASDIWTVGTYEDSSFTFYTLTEHWNGSQWSVVSSPSPGTNNTQFSGVTVVSSTSVWAVGHADSTTLTEHYHC